MARSACAQSNAEFQGCAAKNEAHTSKWGIGGCLFGIGAALLTGGTAAPLALGGCAGGLMTGSATEEDCGVAPSCSSDVQALLAAALAQRQLRGLPACGGYAGFTVRPYLGALASGLLVEQVGANTTAQTAGLRGNDLVFTVNGMRVPDQAALERALVAVPVGAPVAFDVVRNGAIVRVAGIARDVAVTGERSAQSSLGVAFEWRALGVFAGSAVAGVDPMAPAARAGLLPGDVIFRIDTTLVRTADDIAAALGEKRGGAVVAVSVFRAGAPAMMLLTLDPRRDRAGL